MASRQDVARDLAVSLLADPRHGMVTVWKSGDSDYGSTVNGALPPAGAAVLTERVEVFLIRTQPSILSAPRTTRLSLRSGFVNCLGRSSLAWHGARL